MAAQAIDSFERRAFRAYRRSFLRVTLVAFAVYLPVAAVGAALEHSLDKGTVPYLIQAVVLFVGLYWLQAIHGAEATRLADEDTPERRHELSRHHGPGREVRERFGPLAVGMVLIALAYTAASLLVALFAPAAKPFDPNRPLDDSADSVLRIVLFILLVLFLPLTTSLLPTIIVVERWGPFRSFRRMLRCMHMGAENRSKDGPWGLAVVSLVIGLGSYYALRAILQAAIPGPGWVGSFLADVFGDPLIAPTLAILWAGLYLELRQVLNRAGNAESASRAASA